MTEAVGDSEVGSGVALDAIANSGRDSRIIVYGELEALYNVPEYAAFTCGPRVAPGHMRGIEIPHDDEGVLLSMCECGLKEGGEEMR